MTTKQTAATVNTIIAKPEHIALAKQAGQAALGLQTMRSAIDECCKLLREAKAKVGDARTCLIAKAFLAERFPKGLSKAGKPVSAASKAVILSCFRKAVETGAIYNENASKAKAKAKALTKQDAPKATDAAPATKPAQTAPATKQDAPIVVTKPAAPIVVTKPAKDDAETIVLSLPRKSSAKQAAKQMRAFIEKMRQSEELAALAAYIVDVLDEFDGTAEQY